MARMQGRAPRGERLRAAIPHGHWKTTTFVAGMRSSGMVAPMVLDGPINGAAFQAYVEQLLLPELRPGDTVIPSRSDDRAPFRNRMKGLLAFHGQSRQPQGPGRPRGH